MIAGSLITMGTLGDRIGRRRLLLIGAAAFGVASVLAAFSTSAAILIATRALLGIAGATLAPSTLSLIRNMFLDPGQRTVAIGVWVTSYSVGGAIGPLLGGVLLQYFWWGSVFLLGVPAMLLLLVLGPVLLPEFRDPQAGRLDLFSAALSLAAVLAVIYGLKQNIRPGVAESCDGYDNNCDGTVDEGCVTCTDADNDGAFAQANCGGPVDCDDTRAITRPGVQEICDALDNNCDAITDEGFDLQSDPSNCGACGIVCAARGPGLPAACSAGACLPPEPETCDSVDNDLDGEVDEGFNVGTPCFCGSAMPPGILECRPDGQGSFCAC